MSWVIGVLLLFTIYLMIQSYYKKRKIYKIIVSVLLILFLGYSFFTYDGAVRISAVFLMGNPVKTYTEKIVEGTPKGNSGSRYFTTENQVILPDGNTMGYLECRNYTLFKICEYYGFG